MRAVAVHFYLCSLRCLFAAQFSPVDNQAHFLWIAFNLRARGTRLPQCSGHAAYAQFTRSPARRFSGKQSYTYVVVLFYRRLDAEIFNCRLKANLRAWLFVAPDAFVAKKTVRQPDYANSLLAEFRNNVRDLQFCWRESTQHRNNIIQRKHFSYSRKTWKRQGA